MRQPTLRWQLAAILSFTVLILPACAPAATPTAAPADEISGELTILDWSGFDDPALSVDFHEAYPEVIVDYLLGVSDDDIFVQAQSIPGADVVHIYTPFLKFYVDEGLIRELDTAQLTYWDQVPAEFQQMCTIEGKVYCMPSDWGLTSIIYRTDKITEPVDSWDALFDEQYAGHVAMWDSGFGAYEVGSSVLGYDIANLTDAQIEDIKQLWISQKALEPFYWVDEADNVQAMINGDIWISYGWNGGFYSLLSEDVPVAFATPSEGRFSYVGMYAVTTESDNVDAALAFIDNKFAEQSSATLLTAYGYVPVNPAAYRTVEDTTLIDALSLDDPSALDRTNFTKPFSYETLQKFIATWAEIKALP